MKKLVIAGAVVAAFAAAQSAAAQERLRANERYCLETDGGGGDGGGGSGPLLCRYETLARCMASRTGQSDRCTLNPAIGAQPIR